MYKITLHANKKNWKISSVIAKAKLQSTLNVMSTILKLFIFPKEYKILNRNL